MEDKALNSEQSLEIITRMIAQTRSRLERRGGTMFLLWGYLSAVVSALCYTLVQCYQIAQASWLWWLIPLIGYPTSYILRRNKPKQVLTYIDRCVSFVWIAIGSAAILYPIIGMFNPFVNVMIIPLESMLLSIGVLITGLIISFRPLIIGGSISIALSLFMFFISQGYEIVFVAMFVASMIIPGHILNHRGKCSKS